ncbi:MAG: (d)CMP kinase, partial [Treponema sp.]|nr:(d)CMP kinase [Treponema sp.]
MVIAIDGPAGAGKSAVAKMLAEKLSAGGKPFTYINSGSLYRAVTLGCLRTGVDPADSEKAVDFAKKARLDYRDGKMYLDGEMVEDKLHSDEIDRFVSPLSAIVPIRHVVNDHIRKIAAGLDAIVEGRDMTTVV